ncbi:hypothetical protein Pint_14407 [Pistacia integerrima]|uniref:Uncharacterized protein n=1 Tax=Pistacia integerrima TaxID=434235 RepID=A0ACC0Y4T6_9ROSI|nr:hypothetical protein Pint_14407 [Pistacia integerrima]
MEIHVKKTSIVRPDQETPYHSLWISNLDLLHQHKGHTPLVYFYRRPPLPAASDKSNNFFDTSLLKEALSKALVGFYPLAGRLGRDENGRLQIECNGEGALFMEAETSCAIDEEFGEDEFSPSLKMRQLVPAFDYSARDFSSYTLLVLQVTYFKCGGVCLGVGWDHLLGDGTSAFHFIKLWAELTLGFSDNIQPFIDRTILDAYTPPSPTFDHVEYHAPTSINAHESQSSPIPTMARLKLSFDQINTLKEKLKRDHGVTYTTYEILATHIWHCVCKARGLSNDQETKLYIPTNRRSRLNLPLPFDYLGNVLFSATPLVLVGDIQSNPLIYTVEIIHEALKQVKDEYLRSTLAYLKQHDRDQTTLKQRAPTSNFPNLKIVSWLRMPVYDTDFGWGKPIYMGRAIISLEGTSFILPNPSYERSLSLIICLENHHMELFKKFFYSEELAP